MCTFDLREQSLVSRIQVAEKDVAVPSVLVDPSNANVLYCCTGSDIQSFDRRKVGPSKVLGPILHSL